MECLECGKPIPKERLKVLPNTTTCVKCSQEKPVLGMVIWDGNRAETITVNAEDMDKDKYLFESVDYEKRTH
jgi:hypothetical protein